ncbi:MBL fold metallo-hydrolase [Pseudofulvibacter geojedonensis]|uniref:Rhodanese-like domain-containing protein n=1 Tax=Pseudofulvibacter geojedonensis TaxID=1123758 RepID=A0ABW3I1S1_9FLAO
MKIEQLYTKCLSEATYYIMSKGEAAVIDPLRDIASYLEKAKRDKAKIKYVFLTHFHADYVSGHVDLAKATGATIVYGPTATADFDFYKGKDNELFTIGRLKLKLLHTPGHTLESSSYLLFDEEEKEYCLFSGDTLFINDVGRPDLAVTSSITKEELTEKLYYSLHEKILGLPDHVLIYPNHGKGSACGKNMSNETYDTLANQKKVNYALNTDLSKEEFVKQVLNGLAVPPQYFPKNAKMNKRVNTSINEIIARGMSPIEVNQYQHYLSLENVMLLDVRSPKEYLEKHIPNSVFIGLDGTFASWVGTLIENINQPIILLAPDGREEEAVTRLARVGYDNVLGYIKGGINAWEKEGLIIESIQNLEADDLELLDKESSFLDVRSIKEFGDDRVNVSENLPLNHIHVAANSFEKEKEYFVYCKSGYRSVIAISFLKQKGFNNLININGGFNAIKKSLIPTKNCKKNCPTCACNK